ncbi:hypothetical protein [Weissella paramesenteroides]|uniref:Uncharacterized protein n=1 Tax=Weissella paramesenteroides ATCC 33313 TaxID=585506 RepID=C5R870_WEIPA|nr:hypothetical protein [Weissella paramesenteroides]EER75654.1 hypothetical protein HMPREF0877_0165 [Weissella paramesenteroides ATCC 33313]
MIQNYQWDVNTAWNQDLDDVIRFVENGSEQAGDSQGEQTMSLFDYVSSNQAAKEGIG